MNKSQLSEQSSSVNPGSSKPGSQKSNLTSMPTTPGVRAHGGFNEKKSTHSSKKKSQKSYKGSQKDLALNSSNTQLRVETAGDRQSVADEHNEMTESVNIQTSAVLFEKKDHDVQSSMTGDYVINYKMSKGGGQSFKSKSSKKSAGTSNTSKQRSGPPSVPPSKTQENKVKSRGENRSKSKTSDNLSVYQLQSEHQQLDKMNAQIQRDNAALGDANLLMPVHEDSATNQSSGLLMPFPKTLQKQTTGRNDKKESKPNALLTSEDSPGLLVMPGPAIKRGQTKVENNEDTKNDTLDQNALLGVTSLKSITRPSNVSGMGSVISPSSYHEPLDGDDDGGSNMSQSDLPKPSVHFGQFDKGEETVTVLSKNTSQQQADLKSQKSFKTHDSKTIVMVETQIQILNNPNNKKSNIDESAELIAKPKKSEVGRKRQNSADRKSDVKTQKSRKSIVTQDSATKSKSMAKKQMSLGRGSVKTAAPTMKQTHLISSRANRDAQSDKNHTPVKISKIKSSDSKASLASGGKKSALKIDQGGLLSIEEYQDEQPEIKVQLLGETSPAVQLRQDGQDPTSNVNVTGFGGQDQVAAGASPGSLMPPGAAPEKSILDALASSTVAKPVRSPNGAFSSNIKKAFRGIVQDKLQQLVAEQSVFQYNPLKMDIRNYLSQQAFAHDFFMRAGDDLDAVKDDLEELENQEEQSAGDDDDAKKNNPMFSKLREKINEEISAQLAEQEEEKQAKLARRAERRLRREQSALTNEITGNTSPTPKNFDLTTPMNKEEDSKSPGFGGFALRRGKGFHEEIDWEEVSRKEEQEKVSALETQVQQLKDMMIKRQNEFQDLVLSKTMPPPPKKLTPSQERCKKFHQGNSSVVSNNQGYIGTINQPVYNINIYPGADAKETDGSPTSKRSVSPSVHEPTFYAIGKPNRPNSSAVYSPGGKVLSSAKKRPMTAAVVSSARATQKENLAVGEGEEEQPLQDNEFILDQKISMIDFQLQARPISAATYQLGRNQQRAKFQTEGQVSDYRFNPDQILAQYIEQQQSDKFGGKRQQKAGFHPQTNLGSQKGVERTQGCYSNVLSNKHVAQILQNPVFERSSAGQTGITTVHNKSAKILQKAYSSSQPKTLNPNQPLYLKTQPMYTSLAGCVLQEQVQLFKQKNKSKHGYMKNNKLVNRHEKLKKQAFQNEDIFDPVWQVDDYIRETYPSKQQNATKKESAAPAPGLSSQQISLSRLQEDSDDSDKPGLTKNTHIHMTRNFMGEDYYQKNRYTLEQNDKEIKMHKKHFQPIFFSPNNEMLQQNTAAYDALKEYRKFRYAKDIKRKLKKKLAAALTRSNLGLEKLFSVKSPKTDEESENESDSDKSIEGLLEEKKDLQQVIDSKVEEAKKLWKEKQELEESRQENYELRHMPMVGKERDQKKSVRPDSFKSQVSSNVTESAEQSPGRIHKKTTPSQRRQIYGMKKSSMRNLRQSMLDNPLSSNLNMPIARDVESPSTRMPQVIQEQSERQMLHELTKKSSQQLSGKEKQLNSNVRSLVDRLHQPTVPRPRRMLNSRINSQPSDLTEEQIATPMLKQRGARRHQSILSAESGKSSILHQKAALGANQGSDSPPGGVPKQLARPTSLQKRSSKLGPNQSQSSEMQSQIPSSRVAASSATGTTAVAGNFRPFSASAGGGTYLVHEGGSEHDVQQLLPNQTQRGTKNASGVTSSKKLIAPSPINMQQVNNRSRSAQRNQEAPISSNTGARSVVKEKSLGVFSNSTQTTKVAKSGGAGGRGQSRPPKNEKSVMSADPAAKIGKKPQVVSNSAGIKQRNVTSSSDKQTSQSVMTDARTISTQPVVTGQISKQLAATDQNSQSLNRNQHDSQTNTESDVTNRTLIYQAPTNIINRRPSMAVKLEDSSAQGESYQGDEHLQLVRNQSSDSNKEDSRTGSVMKAMLINDQDGAQGKSGVASTAAANQNIEVSVTQLDDTTTNNQLQSNKTSFLIDEDVSNHLRRTSFLSPQESSTGEPASMNIKNNLIQIKISSDALGEQILSASRNSKMEFYADDSESSMTNSSLAANAPKAEAIVVQGVQENTISHSKTQTVSPSGSKVPNLMITQLHRSIGDKDDSSTTKVELLKALTNPSTFNLVANTDRNLNEPSQLGNQDSSQTSRANDTQKEKPDSMKQALIVPQASQRRKQMLKIRQQTKDSQSSVLTANFKDDKNAVMPAETPSAKSEFSFAVDANRKDFMGFKNSQGSNQSQVLTKRQATQLLSPSQNSKKHEYHHTGSSNIDKYSDTTSEERSRILADNIDLLDLDAGDSSQAARDAITPKSAHFAVKPIFPSVNNEQ